MNCPHCQAPMTPEAQSCSRCGQPARTYGGPPPVKGDATGGIIPYKNGPALIAYYLGLFSILPFIGIALGIAAVVLGVMGLQKFKQTPQVEGKVHAYIGIGCGGLGALVWLGFLALILIPALAN